MSENPRLIWLDTDPGFDDWMAWALLQADPAVHLLGLSVVAGNAPLPSVLSNACRIQALHAWTTPIHAGCDCPLVQPQVTAQDVLGAAGMRSKGAALPAQACAPQSQHGVDAIIEAVRRQPGEVTLLAIGPLTNVATAFGRAPDLPGLLKQLVVMGGSQGAGNTTPVAEFNIYADPEAAAQVFEALARLPEPRLWLFGLEVCRQVLIGETQLQALRRLQSPAARTFTDHLDAYLDIGRRRGRPGTALYDPTPVAWLAHPDWFVLQPARVDVELHGRYTRGMTVCEMRVPQRAQPNAWVATQADGPKVLGWATELLLKAWAAGDP